MAHLRYLLTLLLLKTSLYFSVNGYSIEDGKILLANITSGYDKRFRPVRNQYSQVEVNATFDLVAIQDFDEIEEKISMTGILYLSWFDELLTWNPEDFGGAESLTIPTTMLWVPELLHANSADEVNRLVEDWHLVVLHYDGTVEYLTGELFTSACSLDVSYYPFDTQFCSLLFVLAGYDKSQVQLRTPSAHLLKTLYETNGAWSLKDTRARIKTAGYFEDSILSFEVTLERESRFVLVNVIIPIIFMKVLNPLVFLMTNESGERISYCTAVLLTIAVFLTLVGDNIPKTSNPFSIYSYFLLSILIVSIFIVFATIYSLRLYYRSERNEIGSFWKTIVYVFGGKKRPNHDMNIKSKASSICRFSAESDVSHKDHCHMHDCIPAQDRRIKKSYTEESRHTQRRTDRRRQKYKDSYAGDITWMDVSKTLDRIFFVFFYAVATINTIVFLVLMKTG